jgi:hypothetical protein
MIILPALCDRSQKFDIALTVFLDSLFIFKTRMLFANFLHELVIKSSLFTRYERGMSARYLSPEFLDEVGLDKEQVLTLKKGECIVRKRKP